MTTKFRAQSVMKPKYIDRLKAHPGKEMATYMTLLGAFAGMSNKHFSVLGGAIFGALIMGSITWGIVLWTARTQPIGKKGDE